MTKLAETSLCIGRILLSLIFVMSGIHKLTAWQSTADQMQAEGMVAVPFLLTGAVVLELGGGISLFSGCRTRVGATMLIVFLIPTTLIFHDFWAYSGDEQQQQMIHFVKNLAILGGLFAVAGSGGGCCSLDQLLQNRKTQSGMDKPRAQS